MFRYVILLVAIAGIVGSIIAIRKGRSPIWWFILCALFPLLIIVIALLPLAAVITHRRRRMMGILDNLLGRKRCMVCGGSLKDTGGGKVMLTGTSGDVTAASSNYGQKCATCNDFVHFKCCKLESWREGELTMNKGSCPKCGRTLLTLMKA